MNLNFTKNPLIFFLFISVIFASCQPSRQLSFQPIKVDTENRGGKKIGVKSQAGIKVAVSHEFSTNEYLVFRVAIQNKGDETILIDPDNFYYIPKGENRNFRTSNYIKTVSNSEALKGVEYAFYKEHKRHKSASAVGIGLGILAFAADIAANEMGANSSQIFNKRFAREAVFGGIAILSEVNEAKHEKALWEIEQSRSVLDFEPMNIQSLMPGEQVEGKIIFPYLEDSDFLLMYFPFGADIINIDFALHN
ncbi:hypothetical protein [Flexithrix dorotheae]|uniref:hypothetical protein n=1 Tax=Flexithrix dorotheae TaxID=70993 RepID=UPI00037F0384|nr:hypothetical protein [Flexithrix dorotheae]